MRNSILTKTAGLCCVLAVLSLSCGPKKRVVPSGGSEVRMSGKDRAAVLRHFGERQLQYTTFSGRAKSILTINGKERYDVTANVRILRDKAVWISVTALMGMEVARVLITPDSIKVINRLQAEYVREPFAYLYNFTGSDLGFSSLEQLLVGDVIDRLAGDDLEVWKGAGGYLLRRQVEDSQYAARLDTDYENNYTSIVSPVHGQQLEAFYSDYQPVGENSFPNKMEISVATPHFTLRSEMRYSRVAYDEAVEMPFSVPARFTEVQ